MSGRTELMYVENGRPNAAICGRRHRTDPTCPECARIVRAIELRRHPPPAKPKSKRLELARLELAPINWDDVLPPLVDPDDLDD